MTHWKKFLDKEFLYAYDLDGKDVTITIERVTGGEVKGKDGKSSKKPILHIKGTPKKLALNATNGSTIAQLYGNDIEGWVGKRITLFPTTTTFGRETVECIRVRPKIPNGKPGAPSGPPPGAPQDTPIGPPPDVDDVDAMAARDAEGA